MGSLSIWHWLIVLAVVIIVFGGRGRLSSIMSDVGEGIKTFKKQMREDDHDKDEGSQKKNSDIDSKKD